VLVVGDRFEIRRQAFRERPRLHELVVLAGGERCFYRVGRSLAHVGVDVALPQRIGGRLDDRGTAGRVERPGRWRRARRLSEGGRRREKSCAGDDDFLKPSHDALPEIRIGS
jgi:hypothetical protein